MPFIAAFANAVRDCVLHQDPAMADEALTSLAERTRDVVDLSPEQWREMLEQAATLGDNYAKLLKIDPREQASLNALSREFSVFEEVEPA